MSRCFPFPPPGYEIKGRCDDVSTTIKVKYKDKKDNDKKERSDRKRNREGKNKHKEGKDLKKKKHKDKKERKDNKGDRQKCSKEKKVAVNFENQNGQKLDPDSEPCKGIQESKVLVEMGKRIRNCGGDIITLVKQRKADFVAGDNDDIKDKREHIQMANGGVLKGNVRSLGNGLVGNLFGENQITIDQVDKVKKGNDGKDKSKQGTSGDKKDVHKNADWDKNRKVEEGANESRKEPKASDSHGKLLKHNKPVCNDVLHAKANGHPTNNWLKPTLLSACPVGQNRTSLFCSRNSINLAVQRGESATSGKVNGEVISTLGMSKIVRTMERGYSANSLATDKGRATDYNHAIGNGLISSHIVGNLNADGKFQESSPLLENRRKFAQPDTDKAADQQVAYNIHKMDNEEHRMTGKLGCRKDNSLRLSSSCEKIKEKSGTPTKPPHPDLKYLRQILNVPILKWHQFDDQEWLFGQMDFPAKKPKLALSRIEWIKPVWAEAIQLESTDVTAMPYVVPY